IDSNYHYINTYTHPVTNWTITHHPARSLSIISEQMRKHSYLMGLIGEGVRPSLTPPMHEQEGAAQCLRFVYRPIDLNELYLLASDMVSLLNAVIELGFDAFNITHTCNQVVVNTLDVV